MKFTDSLINKYGYDKLLHFTLGGWITAISGVLFGWIGAIITVVLISALSVYKELKLDTNPDWKDFYYALYGCGISLIITVICAIIKAVIN